MFGLGKKSYTSEGVAELIVRAAGASSGKVTSQADQLISINPDLAPLRLIIIYEAQCISVVAGIYLIKMAADPRKYQSLLDDVIHFYRKNTVTGTTQALINEIELQDIKNRLDTYWTSFNCLQSYGFVVTLEDIIENVANSAKGQITLQRRDAEIDDQSLEALEKWLKELVNAALSFFRYQFEQEKII
jgi:hypothetical protein